MNPHRGPSFSLVARRARFIAQARSDLAAGRLDQARAPLQEILKPGSKDPPCTSRASRSRNTTRPER